MKLTKIALLALSGCEVEIKLRIADAIGVTEATFYRYLRENNGNLTKVAAIRIIREATGLTEEQILEESKDESISV